MDATQDFEERGFERGHGFVVMLGRNKYLGRRDEVVGKSKAFVFVSHEAANRRRKMFIDEFENTKVIRVKGIPTIMRAEGDSHDWTIEKGGNVMPIKKKKSEGKPKKKAAETGKAVAKVEGRNERRRKEWKKGDVTPAGCEIVNVKHDPGASGGHTTILTVKCLETGKSFDIFTQDAHQTKYHPSVRDEMKRRDRREKRSKAKDKTVTAEA